MPAVRVKPERKNLALSDMSFHRYKPTDFFLAGTCFHGKIKFS